ncbi:MAG: nucleoside deaminase [Oscillospiraceae bacterium]|jgi:tRNA(adenine34) deaminase|nr:nucleoside deaminase [Oscillospiraceae bacterium]
MCRKKVRDELYMKEALKFAEKSLKISEVPVGAVIVLENEIISTGMNKREFSKNALWHAEIEAINSACKKIGAWRLLNCEIFITLEPCLMCTGAIINSRIKRLVFGAFDTKSGACGSAAINCLEFPFAHYFEEIKKGVLENECSEILKRFFKKLR